MKLQISERVLDKLKHRHGVTIEEVQQCFENRCGGFLEDKRPENVTDPPTQWFIAETNQCRKLKVVFIQRTPRGVVRIDIRSAFEPNDEEIRIYAKYGR
ncbi:MAG TPA: hypothetical protein VGV09_04085 [Steroidobacteraceae bacterium]|nr:hypothetical protein [Steroidobacteraceae bacterium]